jgi:hypothetical protein
MSTGDLCVDLERGLGELFTCAPQGEFQRIRTPYLYPDGDNIDLFLKADGNVVTVSDLGETMRLACVPRRCRRAVRPSRTP